jgi:hypothetical protein
MERKDVQPEWLGFGGKVNPKPQDEEKEQDDAGTDEQRDNG